ncbi:conserved hypothetical protein [Micromonospora sp. ATCC 39149]|uniref:Ribulose 1,5-bisphosphate carboxylase large subunit n=1 Tax=Micromonospora carbonacea TaxID=47853 RepID=A0A7D5Y6S9_9ACTN|nr:hypothetical protein [Micromonospora sp. ATCC 39149]EEP73811.1 conserved hypothetical protein [Micromonospora sp. ATCC 39149]QLJ99712.1 hypothetical protein HZU44_06280 [Micromonospora carbonacea]
MVIPLPRPSAVVGLTRSALDQALGSAASFAAVPARAFAVLDGVEALLARIHGVVDRIEETLDRTDRVLDSATEVATAAAVVVGEADAVAHRAAEAVTAAAQTVTAAGDTVTAAGGAAGTAAELLAAYEPALRRGAPMATRFVEQLSHEEVTAAIRLIDELPRLKEHLTADVLPILATLDRVGPDLHDLLDVTRDLKLAVAGIPGLGMLRRRGEKLTDE